MSVERKSVFSIKTRSLSKDLIYLFLFFLANRLILDDFHKLFYRPQNSLNGLTAFKKALYISNSILVSAEQEDNILDEKKHQDQNSNEPSIKVNKVDWNEQEEDNETIVADSEKDGGKSSIASPEDDALSELQLMEKLMSVFGQVMGNLGSGEVNGQQFLQDILSSLGSDEQLDPSVIKQLLEELVSPESNKEEETDEKEINKEEKLVDENIAYSTTTQSSEHDPKKKDDSSEETPTNERKDEL